MATRLAIETEDDTIAQYMRNLISDGGSSSSDREIKRAVENIRLLKHRAPEVNALKPTQELKYVTACVLACEAAGQYFSKEKAAKLAGVPVKVLETFRVFAAKLLNLENNVSLKDVAIRLGMEECIAPACELLHKFKATYGDMYEGVPEDQAVAVALHVTATKLKLKYPKKILIDLSKLRATGFNLLADQMGPLLTINQELKHKSKQEKHGSRVAARKLMPNQPATTEPEAIAGGPVADASLPNEALTQAYWEERRLSILRNAFEEVKGTNPAKYKVYVRKYKSELPDDFFG